MSKRAIEHEDASPALPFVWPPAGSDEGKPGGFIEPKPGAMTPRPRVLPKGPTRKPTWLEEFESALLGTRSRVLTGKDERWLPEPMEFACPRCGRDVGEGEVSPDDGRCTSCRAEKLSWEKLVRLGGYHEPLREAILATKYEGWRRQGTVLGRLLGERLRGELEATEIEPGRVVLVPVPMPFFRRMSRGIDHSLVLARGVSEASGCRVERLLTRSGGKPQVRVAPSLRAQNVQKRVRAGLRPSRSAELVVLVDDVKTTGATLRACCRAIRRTGWGSQVRLWSAVAAVTADSDRRGLARFSQPSLTVL